MGASKVNSPFVPAIVARPLSSSRGRVTNPPRRQRGLRGGRFVRSGAEMEEVLDITDGFSFTPNPTRSVKSSGFERRAIRNTECRDRDFSFLCLRALLT